MSLQSTLTTDPPLPVTATRFLQLTESLGDHARLSGEVTCGNPLAAILKAVGAKVRWVLKPGNDDVVVFQGVLTGIVGGGNAETCSLSAVGHTISRDLVRRTVSYGGEPSP